MVHCQVTDMSLRDYLPCKHRESGGRQCEREEAHDDDRHYFSWHTILHDRWGNGHHCDSFEDPVNTVGYRAKLVARIAALNAELDEIDGKGKNEEQDQGSPQGAARIGKGTRNGLYVLGNYRR